MRRHGACLVEDLDILLARLCRDWGFCTRLTGASLLRSCGALSAEHFAAAVLWAEGTQSDLEADWAEKIAGRFRQRYGPQISESAFAERLARGDWP